MRLQGSPICLRRSDGKFFWMGLDMRFTKVLLDWHDRWFCVSDIYDVSRLHIRCAIVLYDFGVATAHA